MIAAIHYIAIALAAICLVWSALDRDGIGVLLASMLLLLALIP